MILSIECIHKINLKISNLLYMNSYIETKNINNTLNNEQLDELTINSIKEFNKIQTNENDNLIRENFANKNKKNKTNKQNKPNKKNKKNIRKPCNCMNQSNSNKNTLKKVSNFSNSKKNLKLGLFIVFVLLISFIGFTLYKKKY